MSSELFNVKLRCYKTWHLCHHRCSQNEAENNIEFSLGLQSQFRNSEFSLRDPGLFVSDMI